MVLGLNVLAKCQDAMPFEHTKTPTTFAYFSILHSTIDKTVTL